MIILYTTMAGHDASINTRVRFVWFYLARHVMVETPKSSDPHTSKQTSNKPQTTRSTEGRRKRKNPKVTWFPFR
jgi:hypothetical protein